MLQICHVKRHTSFTDQTVSMILLGQELDNFQALLGWYFGGILNRLPSPPRGFPHVVCNDELDGQWLSNLAMNALVSCFCSFYKATFFSVINFQIFKMSRLPKCSHLRTMTMSKLIEPLPNQATSILPRSVDSSLHLSLQIRIKA